MTMTRNTDIMGTALLSFPRNKYRPLEIKGKTRFCTTFLHRLLKLASNCLNRFFALLVPPPRKNQLQRNIFRFLFLGGGGLGTVYYSGYLTPIFCKAITGCVVGIEPSPGKDNLN
jgi:hypothetical protein